MLDLIPYARAMHFRLRFRRILANSRATEVKTVHPSQEFGPSGDFRPTRCLNLDNPPRFSWVLDLILYARAMHVQLCFCGILANGRNTEVEIAHPSQEFGLSGYFGPRRWALAGQFTRANRSLASRRWPPGATRD